MLANVAAIAFTVALMAIGIWLALSIADMRKTQDCVLTGRRDCARIYARMASISGRTGSRAVGPCRPARPPPLNSERASDIRAPTLDGG